jgi:hypothetical protein
MLQPPAGHLNQGLVHQRREQVYHGLPLDLGARGNQLGGKK